MVKRIVCDKCKAFAQDANATMCMITFFYGTDESHLLLIVKREKEHQSEAKKNIDRSHMGRKTQLINK